MCIRDRNYRCETDLRKIEQYLHKADVVAFDFETAPLPAYRENGKAEMCIRDRSAGSAVLSWTQGEEIPAAATLNLEVTGPIDGLPYGSYTDTLTFKATVSGN